MRPNRMLPILFCALAWLAAGPASAERPSLSRIEAATCAKADVDGDSYRPFYCPARCDCGSLQTLQPGTTCTETAPGDFEIFEPGSTPLEACSTGQELCNTGSPAFGDFCQSDPPATGSICTDIGDCPAGWLCASGWGTCDVSGDPCNFASPSCPPGETCEISGLSVCFYAGTSCTTDADCTASFDICGDGTTCASDADCGAGERCAADGHCRTACDQGEPCTGGTTCQLDGLCGRTCTTDADCPGTPIPEETTNLNGVGALDATTAVGGTCGEINHPDARACLVGAGCDLCGDGVVDTGETCDDGNTTPGDGCDASCQTE